MALKSLSTRRSGRRVSITISLSHNEEQHMNKRTKKLHDRPSKTLNSIGLNVHKECSKTVLLRKALANALSIAPSMWILGNAGMGALQVAFTGSERLISDAAKNQVSMNPTNTDYDSTRLIAEKPMIAVNYKGEEKTFTAEEVSSMIAVN
ncbi:heat shock cognate 70 kDa protein 2-like protein [Tanacetum coccineum]